MATYYWVGGTGTWDNATTTSWSSSSGGAGGAGYPVAGDTAIFNSSSGGGTCTLGANVTCAVLTMIGYTGTLAYGTNKITIIALATGSAFTGDTTYSVSGTPLIETSWTGTFNPIYSMGATTESNSVSLSFLGTGSGSPQISGAMKNLVLNAASVAIASANAKTVYGNVTLTSGTVTSSSSVWTFAATSGTQTITSNGNAFDVAITINAPGATVQLADALSNATRATIYTAGSFDLNDFNFTTNTFTATGSGTRVLSMGSGTLTIAGITWNLSGTNITLNAETSTLFFSTTTNAVTFTPGNFAYYNISIQGGSGASVTFAAATGSSYNNITNNDVPLTVTFTAANTYTFTNWNLNGTSVDDVIVTSTTAAAAIISKASGTVTSVYLALNCITATGGATWVANTSWTGLTVTGWTVTDAGTLYWVAGGSNTWDLSSTTNWAATSGGAGGAGCPTSSTRVVFNTSSGAGTVTIGANVECKIFHTQCPGNGTQNQFAGTLAFGTNRIDITGSARQVCSISTTGLTITGAPTIRLTANASSGTRSVITNGTTEAVSTHLYVTAGTDTISGFTNVRDLILTGFAGTFTNVARTVWGSFAAGSGMTHTGSTGIMTLRATSAATIDGAGNTINQPITINATSTYTLVAHLIMNTTRALLFTAGTFDADTYNVTCGAVTVNGASVALVLGAGTWNVTGAWTHTTASSVTCETSTIKMNSGSSKTFAGGGQTYYILDQAGAGALTVSGNNTFNDWSSSYLPSTITVTAGSTQTFTNFTLSGILNDPVTINSTGSTYTFSKASGTVAVSYIAITNCIGSGGATWTATYSTQTTCTNWSTTNLATTYYWVGGTGTWDNSSTARWSLSSGGAGGAGYPLPADIVIFDGSSGAGTCTIGATVNCKTLTMTGYTGTLAFGTNKIQIAGANGTVYTGATTFSITGTTRLDFVYPGRNGSRTIAAGAPTEGNAMNIYIMAGTDGVILSSAAAVRDLIFTSGYSAAGLSNQSRTIYGSLSLSPTMTVTGGSATTTFAGTGTHTIDLNGVQFAAAINFAGVGGTYTLLDNFDIGIVRSLTVSAGTFDAAGYNVSSGTFVTSGSSTKVVNMGSGTWTVSSTGTPWSTPAAGNLTFNPNTSTMVINASSTSSKAISTAGQSNFNNLVLSSQGQIRFSSNVTTNNVSSTTANIAFTLASGVVFTVTTSFTFAGNSTVQSTISNLTPGAIAYLSSANGIIHNPQYLTITDVGATGGAKWDAYGNPGNIDGGNAPGWLWYQSNVSNTAFMEFIA
jgi:hypothetical protein